MRRWPNVDLLLAHRPRRWPNSKPAMDQRLMFAGCVPSLLVICHPHFGSGIWSLLSYWRLRFKLLRSTFSQHIQQIDNN